MSELKKTTQCGLVARNPKLTAVDDSSADRDDIIGKAQSQHLTSSEDSAFYLLRQINQDRGFGDYVDYPTLTQNLSELSQQVHNGDLKQMETMLVASAKTLELMANAMMTRAFRYERLDHLESFLKLGLRAQNQMRHSIETLGRLKNPPVVIAKQANVATNQQINHSCSHEPKSIQPNEQSGEPHELCKNSQTPCDALSNDPSVEAVAEVHRRKDR